ncbi:DUF6238 family protein [Streptacidiphilus fuscans]|uniref:Uncharacterized protein n=1 Tax=Streptacidiphilus fuscans TaxID=2789292 RepID=A0A931B7C6_9ACTN|nr:DUF6238 family protein [Streptacidiphilus fuscans]MBF9071769.1 hypothetical protein [Streptacidiphilus fuscans]
MSDPDLLHYATAALDVHHHTALPEPLRAADRVELDALHAHATALYELLDTHTHGTHGPNPVGGDHLHAARTRAWQLAEHLHDAFHTAPRDDGTTPTREQCAARHPEGAPRLSICRRHVATAVRVRRHTTPAELRAAFTGLVRH